MAIDNGTVVWDVFFKYPFWGSIVAAYIPIKAIAAGLVFILGYVFWTRKVKEYGLSKIFLLAFITTVIYFLLAYIDLATVEFAMSGGTSNFWCTNSDLCGSYMRPLQVFLTPNPSSFIAWGAWLSLLMLIITGIGMLFSITSWIKPLRVASKPLFVVNSTIIRTIGIPISILAGIYTALLFNEATARGLLIDPSLIILSFAYMITLGSGFVYVILGDEYNSLAKSSIIGGLVIIGIFIIQIMLSILGFYRLDAQYAMELLLYGQNPFMQGLLYNSVSLLYKLGLGLIIIGTFGNLLSYRFIRRRIIFAIFLIIITIGIGFTEFARLLAVQFIPNS